MSITERLGHLPRQGWIHGHLPGSPHSLLAGGLDSGKMSVVRFCSITMLHLVTPPSLPNSFSTVQLDCWQGPGPTPCTLGFSSSPGVRCCSGSPSQAPHIHIQAVMSSTGWLEGLGEERKGFNRHDTHLCWRVLFSRMSP